MKRSASFFYLLTCLFLMMACCQGCDNGRWEQLPMLIKDTHCPTPPPTNDVPDEDSPVEKCFPSELLIQIVRHYNASFGYDVVAISEDGPVTISYVPREEFPEGTPDTIKVGLAEWNLDGFIITSGKISILQEDTKASALELIVAHEFTHMLGHFYHDQIGLMAPGADRNKTLKQNVDEGQLTDWLLEKYPELKPTPISPESLPVLP